VLGPLALERGGGVQSRAANTFTVTSTGDGVGSCVMITCTTLRGAIAAAADGDTITFGAGLANVTLSSGLSGPNGPLIVNKSLTIAGPGAATLAIDGGGLSTVFVVASGNSTISGLTIQNGVALASSACPNGGVCGGGIFIESGAALTLNDSTVQNNGADNSYGGGVFNRGTLTMSNVAMAHNHADHGYGGGLYNAGTATINGGSFTHDAANSGWGGGIFNGVYNSGTATLEIVGCFLGANGADGGYGGALFNGGVNNATGNAAVTISNSTFSSNTAALGYGGGINNGGYMNPSGNATVTINGSTFTGNTAFKGYGGAIFGGGYMTSSTNQITISNSTFSGNVTDQGYGGAIYNGRVTSLGTWPILAVANSTFSGNTAPSGYGGAIFNQNGPPSPNIDGIANLGSCIVTGNTADLGGPNIAGTIVSQGNNLIGDPSGVPSANFMAGPRADQTGVALSSTQLAPLAMNGGTTNTMALGGSNNPAVGKGFCAWNSGMPFPAVTVDQRGFARATPCDVGAFELSVATATSNGGCSVGPGRRGRIEDDASLPVFLMLALSGVVARRQRRASSTRRE
jgi:hypothetical protein